MTYVALLRGINVGGNSKVEMARLKVVFEKLGFEDIKTYINSGNVIFSSSDAEKTLPAKIEAAIEKEFKFPVAVVVRTLKNIQKLDESVPKTWVNDTTMKTDVIFLWDEFDSKSILKNLIIKPDIDDVKYLPGAVVWRVDRDKVTKSGLLKIIGTDLYKKSTVRNVNTLRKLRVLMESL